MDMKPLLGLIDGGEQYLKPAGDSLSELQAFQLTVATAAEAFNAGYITLFKPRKESFTGYRLVRIVQVGHLTEEGKTYLAAAA